MEEEIKQTYLDPISNFVTQDDMRAFVNSSLTNLSQPMRLQTKYIESSNYVEPTDTSSGSGWKLSSTEAILPNITLTGGTIRYQKTSFTDTANAGYYISSDGFYFGAANDSTRMKYNITTGAMDYIGTLSNSAGAVILNASAQTILKDFTFSPTDYSGAFKTGDITWNTTTGAITGGSGGLFNKSGLIFASAGVATITLDGATGSATFAGTLSAPSGTLGIINSASLITGNLERNDFHWSTLFESIDGYSSVGSVTATDGGLYMETTADLYNVTEIGKAIPNFFIPLSWDKNRKMRVSLFIQSNTYQDIWIINGLVDADEMHAGFHYNGGTDLLYGTVSNGSFEITVNCGALAAGEHNLEYRYKAGVSIEFFVDGVSKGSIADPDYMPSGSSNAGGLLLASIETFTTQARVMIIYAYDFWQSA